MSTLRRKLKAFGLKEDPMMELRALTEFYAPVRELGRGAFGVVFLAVQVGLDRPVVLKLLSARSLDAQERFLREAKILASLDHPLVPRILDFGLSDERTYMVYPYEEAAPLRASMDARRLIPWSEAVRIAIDLLTALDHAHGKGIVHRDVKPENVLLTTAGQVRLIDFGLGIRGEDTRLTETGAVVGTPAYMCPAQMVEGLIDPRCDLHSVGILLFEMIGAKRPYWALKLDELVSAKLAGIVPELPEVAPPPPPELRRILRSLLNRDPEERPRSARMAIASLQDALDGSAPAPVRPGNRGRVRRPPPPVLPEPGAGALHRSRGRRRAPAAILLVALGLAASLAATWTGRGEPFLTGPAIRPETHALEVSFRPRPDLAPGGLGRGAESWCVLRQDLIRALAVGGQGADDGLLDVDVERANAHRRVLGVHGVRGDCHAAPHVLQEDRGCQRGVGAEVVLACLAAVGIDPV